MQRQSRSGTSYASLMDQRRLPLVGLAAASVIALFGCANAETELAQGPAAVATYEYNHGDGSSAARIIGVLDFSSGCVRFEDGSVPVFASAAIEWVDDALLIEGAPHRDGDVLDSSGGEMSQPLDEGLSIPTECEGHSYLGIGPSRDFMRTFTSTVARACHGEFVADVDTSVEGATSQVGAAEAWAAHTSAPDGAPLAGWVLDEDGSVTNGAWRLGLTRTDSGGWIVSGLDCATPSDTTG